MSIETAPQEHRTTGVIPAAPWWVRAVNVLPGYRLAVTFNDGTSGTVDMSALVNSENAGIYATLKSAEVFQQVSPIRNADLLMCFSRSALRMGL